MEGKSCSELIQITFKCQIKNINKIGVAEISIFGLDVIQSFLKNGGKLC